MSNAIKLYDTVIEDVINGVRETFMDEGVDEQVLQELKQLWETKLHASKAVQVTPEPPQAIPPPIVVNNQKKNVNTPAKEETPRQTLAVGLDPAKLVPIQITLPALENTQARVLSIQIPALALQTNVLAQVLTGPLVKAAMGLPPHLASTLLQQHVNAALQPKLSQVDGANDELDDMTLLHANVALQPKLSQVDGANDDSDDEESDDELDDMSDDDNGNDNEPDDDGSDDGPEEDPLNSGDDVTDEDTDEMFDTDNAVVCQYEKITRCRNKWKFYLKDGIMNLNGKDYVFQKSNGDAEW